MINRSSTAARIQSGELSAATFSSAQSLTASSLPGLIDNLARDPGSVEKHLALAKGLERVGDRKNALIACEDVLMHQPRNIEALHIAARLYRSGVPGFSAADCAHRRQTHLAKILELDPSDGHTWFLLGLTQVERTPDAACASFARAVTYAPHEHDYWDYYGRTLFALGRTTEAVTACETALGCGDGSNTQPVVMLMDHHLKAGNLQKILEVGSNVISSPASFQDLGNWTHIVDLMTIAALDLGLPTPAITPSDAVALSDDIPAVLLDAPLGILKLDTIRSGGKLKVSGDDRTRLLSFSYRPNEASSITGCWTIESNGAGTGSLSITPENNSVRIIYNSGSSRAARLDEVKAILTELRLGDMEEVQAILEGNRNSRCEVRPGLAVELHNLFPNTPLGIFPDLGVGVGEALRGHQICSLSAVNMPPKNIHIIVIKHALGFALTLRRGAAVIEGQSPFPTYLARNAEEISAAVARLSEIRQRL